MSNILALDTSTDACSAALKLGDQYFERFELAPRQHTQLLLPMVESLLTEGGITVRDLSAIAFGRGPGSFAGIRIATGAAQGLALAFETPVVPVSTLEALAEQAFSQSSETYVLATLDARMDEVYWAVYAQSNGKVHALTHEQVTSPQQITLPDEVTQCLAIGPGMRYQSGMLDSVLSKIHQSKPDEFPSATTMLEIAHNDFSQGEWVSPESALPLYIRDGSWKKRNEQ